MTIPYVVTRDSSDPMHGTSQYTNLATACWPVGVIFISTVNENPTTTFGFGVWVPFNAKLQQAQEPVFFWKRVS